jgi:preprotein translocase subunit SecE
VADSEKPTEQSGDTNELIAVGAPRRRTTSPGESDSAVKSARSPKGRLTPSTRRPAKKERTGPIQFVRESIGELRKVVYPTGHQVLQYFVVVLIFVLAIIAYVSLLDLVFGTALFRLFT